VRAELVAGLAEVGEPARALSRSGRADGLPPGVEAVAGDLNRSETVRAALDGVRALFLMPGYDGQRQVLTVRVVTGRAPRTFADWARAHAAAF
jgi:uncharacterized protein YbjT (DUF2867 family)